MKITLIVEGKTGMWWSGHPLIASILPAASQPLLTVLKVLWVMIIISASRKNLDYASQAPLHPGYTGFLK